MESEPSSTAHASSSTEHRPVRVFLFLDLLQDRESRQILLWSVVTWLVGAFAYHWLEGWPFLDALYFCIITLTTIGYGDMAPTTPLAKGFTILYALNGIAILLALLDRIRALRVPSAGHASPDQAET